jgi:hypothetical protein
LRAAVQARARICALAVRRQCQAQSSRFQGAACLSNGGRKVVGGLSQKDSNTFRSSSQVENQMIVTRDRTS